MSHRSYFAVPVALLGVVVAASVAGCGGSSGDDALFGGSATGAGTGGNAGTGTGGGSAGPGGSSAAGGMSGRGGSVGAGGQQGPGVGGGAGTSAHGGNGPGAGGSGHGGATQGQGGAVVGAGGTGTGHGGATQGQGGMTTGQGGTVGQGGMAEGAGGDAIGAGGNPTGTGGMTQGVGGGSNAPPTTCSDAHGVIGCCSDDGTTLYWWSTQNNDVVVTDCGMTGQVCGWTMGQTQMLYDCTSASAADPSNMYPYTCDGTPIAGACDGTTTGQGGGPATMGAGGGGTGIVCGGVTCSTQTGPACCTLQNVCGLDLGGTCVPLGDVGAGGGPTDPGHQDCVTYQGSPNKSSADCSTCLTTNCATETTAASQCSTQGQACHSSCGTNNDCVCNCELMASNGCGSSYKKYFVCISDNCASQCD